MSSTHAKKLIFSQSVEALSGLVLLVTSQIPLTHFLLWLIFFAKHFTMHREKTWPPNTLTSNRWLSPPAYPIIFPKLKNFPRFRRHFQKGQFCKVAKHLERWIVFCDKKKDYILWSQNLIFLPIVLFEKFRFFGPHDWMGQTIITKIIAPYSGCAKDRAYYC